MKKFVLLLFLGLFAVSTINAQEAGAEKKAEVKFEVSKHDFGDITQGDVVEYTFKFKNTGTAPLVLTNVSTTCGCTAPSWPREPIMAGESGEILVKFNSAGKMGMQNKVVTIYSNAVNNPERVSIISNVLPKQ